MMSSNPYSTLREERLTDVPSQLLSLPQPQGAGAMHLVPLRQKREYNRLERILCLEIF